MRRLMRNIKKRVISFRLDAGKKKESDAHARQIERIREGVKQADAGRFVSNAAVAAELRRWRR